MTKQEHQQWLKTRLESEAKIMYSFEQVFQILKPHTTRRKLINYSILCYGIISGTVNEQQIIDVMHKDGYDSNAITERMYEIDYHMSFIKRKHESR